MPRTLTSTSSSTHPVSSHPSSFFFDERETSQDSILPLMPYCWSQTYLRPQQPMFYLDVSSVSSLPQLVLSSPRASPSISVFGLGEQLFVLLSILRVFDSYDNPLPIHNNHPRRRWCRQGRWVGHCLGYSLDTLLHNWSKQIQALSWTQARSKELSLEPASALWGANSDLIHCSTDSISQPYFSNEGS